MCRLPPATKRSASRALLTTLSAGLLAVLMMFQPPPVRAQSPMPRLYSVVIGGARHPPDVRASLRPGFDAQKSYKDLTILAIPLPVFHLTFAEDDSFRFVVPISILYDSQGFGSLGATQYAYTLTYADGSTEDLTIPVPNKLLRIRDAFLAAEDYWKKAAGRSGHSFELIAPGEPIDVNIGYFVRAQSVRAYTAYFRQEIRLRNDLDDEELETTPIHELFHILMHAILRAEMSTVRREISIASYHRLWLFVSGEVAGLLGESTATWSEDEPISVPAGAGGISSINIDIDTNRELDCAASYIESGTDLFERNQYCVSWLIKYYVEQIAGGSDTAMPEVVLDLIARAANHILFEKDAFIQVLAEGLPADRFPGATWQERWQRFYTSFAAAVLVRRPSVAGDPGSKFAFHDDAFADIRSAGRLFPMNSHRRDYLRVPERIYETPAANDTERAERLATIARSEKLPPFAHFYNVLELNVLDTWETQDLDLLVPRTVDARPAFVYARGPGGTNVFLLRQQATVYANWKDRNAGSFERIDDFSLIGSNGAVVSELEDIPASGWTDTYVNLGLVNSGPTNSAREMSWAYLAAPRLIPTPVRSRPFDFQPIAPVRLIGGSAYSAYDAGRRDQFENGDSFVFEVTVTGKLHLGADSRENIPEDERTIQLAIACGGDDRPVLLEQEDGRAIKVAASPSPRDGPNGRFYYLLSGRIDPNNTDTGDCRVQVELTSLLNLGGGDRQVDESYAFRIGDPVPEVSRVRVTSGDTVVYDTQDNILRAVKPTDGAYKLKLKVWFSTELSENGASVLAGLRQPYDAYEVPADTSISDVPSWSTWKHSDDPPGVLRSVLETELTVPELNAPNGGFLWFSISATSTTGVLLDSDPTTPGDQRDKRHFAMLGMDDYYLVTLSAKSSWTLKSQFIIDYGERISKEVRYQPFEVQFRLLPYFEVDDHRPPMGSFRAPLLMESWQRMMQGVRTLVTQKQGELAAVGARLNEIEKVALPDATGANREALEAQADTLRRHIETLEGHVRARQAEQGTLRRYEEDFRTLIRLLQNGRSYRCSPHNDLGPVPARFGGMKSDTLRQKWDPKGQWRREAVTTASAPAWKVEDTLSLGWPELYQFTQHDICPQLEVWDYDAADLARARELLLTAPLESIGPEFGVGVLITIHPSTLISTLPPLPNGHNSLSGIGLSLELPEFVRTATGKTSWRIELRQAFKAIFTDALKLMTNAAWRFAFKDEGILEFGYYIDGLATEHFRLNNVPMRLPTLPPGPLFRLGYQPEGIWPYPVDIDYRLVKREWSAANFTEEIEDARLTGAEEFYDLRVGEPRFVLGPTDLNLSVQPNARRIAGQKIWTLDTGTGSQVTNWTTPGHILSEGPQLVVQGQLRSERNFGGIEGTARATYRFGSPETGEIETRHKSRYHWMFERSAFPGLPDREPESQVVAGLPDPENEDPGDDPAEENGEEPEEQPEVVETDDPDDEPTTGTTDDEPSETPDPPDEDSDPAHGWPVPATVVQPTVQYPGVVQGIITNGSRSYEPGHVAVYLTGEDLPPRKSEPLQMELNAGFPQSFVGIAAGRSIRFHNGEAQGGPHYYIFTDSELAKIDHVIQPGEEAVIPFPQQGRLKVRNNNNTTQVLEVAVLPSTRFNVLNTISYIIREVPPGTYTLTATAENRRYQPFTTTVEIPAVGRLQQDITLIERGSRIGGLAVE